MTIQFVLLKQLCVQASNEGFLLIIDRKSSTLGMKKVPKARFVIISGGERSLS